MSIDPGMDLEEELLPLIGRDAPHEHPQCIPLVEFVAECDEGPGMSSDPSGLRPFGWENLLEEVGE